MILKGQKRKFPLEDVEDLDRDGPNWESQRQFVFSVSLSKYQRSQELPEPSLRRSVLITNTLRQISLDASRTPPTSPPVVDMDTSQPDWDTAEKHCPTFDDSHSSLSTNYLADCSASRPPPPPSRHSSETDVNMTAEDEDWGSMSADQDFSLSAAISSILTALDSTVDGSSQAVSQRTPLRSLENLSAPQRSHGEWQEQEATRSGFLSELAVEDLFQDIDTLLLETDGAGVLGLRSSSSTSGGDDLFRHLAPSSHSFSRSLNPHMKCLPSFSSFSPLTSSSSSSSSSASLSSPASQNHVREAFEMDHLMEILVES